MFFSETLVSSRRHIYEVVVPEFSRPMQLLRNEADRLRGLAVYVCIDSAVMSVDVVKS